MSRIGNPRKGFNTVGYNWQKQVRDANRALTDDERRILLALKTYGGGVDFTGTESRVVVQKMVGKGLCHGEFRNLWPTELGHAVIR